MKCQNTIPQEKAHSIPCTREAHPGFVWCLPCINHQADLTHKADRKRWLAIENKDPQPCYCYMCLLVTWEERQKAPDFDPQEFFLHSPNNRMVLCEVCHNKRCSHATDHNLACNNSNEPEQWGSRYSKAWYEAHKAKEEPEPLKPQEPIVVPPPTPGKPLRRGAQAKLHKCPECDAARFEKNKDFCENHTPKEKP